MEENKARAKYLVELAVTNLASALQMFAIKRPDLARHFIVEAAKQAALAKRLDNGIDFKSLLTQ